MVSDFISKVNHFKWTGFQDIDWVFQGFILDLGSLDLEIGLSTVNGFFLDTSGYDLQCL